LRCPKCRSALDRVDPGQLRCRQCGSTTAIVNGIPRFVSDDDFEAIEADARTRASFGYEWTHFHDWKPSERTFGDYFSNFDLEWLRGRLVLDAGCGMGRHARQIAPFADTVVAVDFSAAINEAARNVADQPNVQCVQGDLTRLPVAEGAFDFVFSMGVLHHLEDLAPADLGRSADAHRPERASADARARPRLHLLRGEDRERKTHRTRRELIVRDPRSSGSRSSSRGTRNRDLWCGTRTLRRSETCP